MTNRHIVIIGGGLAGLSTGCYARVNGWEVTILEHGSGLGGVCTAWQRGPYTIDGCIHWLTGGPFSSIYEELQIVPPVQVHTLAEFSRYRHERQGYEVAIARDLDALRVRLHELAPSDRDEIDRLIEAARNFTDMPFGIDQPAEITGLREQVRALWDMRAELPTFLHYRKTVATWTRTRLQTPALRRLFERMFGERSPMLVALMVLGYLGRGWLSRPYGGTAAFRDALVDRFHALGGRAYTDATVEEILVVGDRATGVRLRDGTIVGGDVVVSTASAPETVFQLLGGRYGAGELEHRLAKWKIFDGIVLASFGLDLPLADVPSTLLVDGIEPAEIGGRPLQHLYVRIYNDDPSFAPAGHSVVQVMADTDYDWWATRGSGYAAAQRLTAELLIERLEGQLPGIRDAVRMIDVATPLTYWRAARSWRGAYEGWLPTPESLTTHVPKTLPGLHGFYMAGQWVQPGGGVPLALMSGRQLVQILCHDQHRPFAAQAA